MENNAANENTEKNQKLGHDTALTLIGEMRFLKPPPKRADDDTLIDHDKANAERPDFQQINKEDVAKSNLAADFIANLAGLRYCVGDGQVLPVELFATDHTHAFSAIEKKQAALISYLNDPNNKDFAEGFLSAQDIKQYFGSICLDCQAHVENIFVPIGRLLQLSRRSPLWRY
jgi:hypothetical protein